MLKRAILTTCSILFLAASWTPSGAGSVNPDISVLGQPTVRWTNDASDASPKRVVMDQGEVETIFDAYLNPYAKGYFVLALADEGLELEEGYFTILRGLPGDLQVKGGKYRVGFGKLNVMHGHQLPFAERPRVLAEFLPGEESFGETGVSVSGRIPLPGAFALTAAGDWLQGDGFRIPREPGEASNDPLAGDEEGDRPGEARPAFVGHLSGFGQLGDRSGYELAASWTGGTNNVAAGTRTYAWDAAGKLKLWTAPSSYLLLHGELLGLDRQVAGWDSTEARYTSASVRPVGGFAYADYNFSPRYDAGLFYERYQRATPERTWDQAFGAFVGVALMEETTCFRLDWSRFLPGADDGAPDPEAVDTVALRVIFSMGPHKAHQF